MKNPTFIIGLSQKQKKKLLSFRKDRILRSIAAEINYVQIFYAILSTFTRIRTNLK